MTKYLAPGIQLKVDEKQIQEQIYALQAANMELDYMIPSEWEKMERNSRMIDKLADMLTLYKCASSLPLSDIDMQTPLISLPETKPVAKVISPPEMNGFKVITKKHLTLVWSQNSIPSKRDIA